MFNRSRLNLAHWFATSMGAILIMFAGVVYYFGAKEQLQEFDYALFRKGKAIAAQTQYRFTDGQWQLEPETPMMAGQPPILLQDGLLYARWYDARGRLVKSLGAPIPATQARLQPIVETIALESNPERLRQATIAIKQDNQTVGYLQIATPLKPLQESLNQSLLFLTLGLPVALGLTGLTGWWLGGMAMQPIRQSYERLQRFTADASHELRAPLATILSNTQVALLPMMKDEHQKNLCLKEVEKSAKSMKVLIDHLLFLARHERPQKPDTFKRVNLVDVLHPLLEQSTLRATQKNLIFTSHLPEQPVLLKADPELLRQATNNLLDNAFKYTISGGQVWLRVLIQPRWAVIQVEDTGVGIPAQDLPHIFERFYRVDAARSRQTGGFGLGLSIAWQIIKTHGGHITAQSVVGKGTVFQIELPLAT